MRGGFKSTVRSATGGSDKAPPSPTRKLLSNLLTIALLIVAAFLLLRRFGVIH